MNHYLSKKAYVFLNFFIYAGLTGIFNIFSGNLYRLGAELPLFVIIACKIGIAFAATYMTAGRFLAIEKRKPDPYERNSISFWGFLLIVLGMLLYIPIAMGLSQMRSDLNSQDVLMTLLILMAILSTSHFVFLQLNLGIFMRMRTTQA